MTTKEQILLYLPLNDRAGLTEFWREETANKILQLIDKARLEELDNIPKYYMRGDMAYTLDYISDRIKALNATKDTERVGK